MKFGSVCSGIEAASVAWHPLGWTAAWLSEIEPFPCAVLKHHYPKVPNLGDMTKFKEWKIESNINVFVGGTPCQSFSVAGLRKGLDDPRGNLMLTYLAIAKQHRPRWLVWENVPGVLSSADGRDFGSFLGGLAICGYGFAYRVLDAQYFGVAQRRKRVFVVGYLGDWRPAAAVLFERHSLQGHPAPSREKRESSAASFRSGVAEVCPTIGCELAKQVNNQMVGNAEAFYIPEPIAFPANLSGTQHASTTNLAPSMGALNPTAVMQPIPLNTMNLLGREIDDGRRGFGIGESGDPCPTLTKHHSHAVCQPIPIHDQATRHAGKNGEKTMGKGNGLGIGQPGDPMNTLTKGDHHAVAYNIAPGKGKLKDDIHVTDAYIAKTIDASGSNPSMHQGGAAIVQPVGVDIFNAAFSGEVAVPLTNRSDGTGTGPTVMQSMAVRRLTPIECERLQGFPDHYTDIKPKGKPTPDGPRYKALGNSMAVPVMAWIGKRIQEVENIK
jgi:DNA (cytosine-5)-methyltransferase 1